MRVKAWPLMVTSTCRLCGLPIRGMLADYRGVWVSAEPPATPTPCGAWRHRPLIVH